MIEKILHKLFDYPHGPLWRLWSIFGIFMVATTLGMLSVVEILAAFFRLSRAFQTVLIQKWCRFCLWICRMKLVVEGRENHSADSRGLVISNHQSLFDIPCTFVSMDGDIRMLAKRELSRIPFFGWAMGATEFVFLDRESPVSRQRAARRIAERIKSGLQFWVAAEGTRSVGDKMNPFKTGSFGIAIEAGVPICPFMFMNTHEAMLKKSWFMHPGTVIYSRVLPHFETKGLAPQDKNELAQRVQAQMQAALDDWKATHRK